MYYNLVFTPPPPICSTEPIKAGKTDSAKAVKALITVYDMEVWITAWKRHFVYYRKGLGDVGVDDEARRLELT